MIGDGKEKKIDLLEISTLGLDVLRIQHWSKKRWVQV